MTRAHGCGSPRGMTPTERTPPNGSESPNQECCNSGVSLSHLFISATLDLGVWRHICLGLDFKEGQIILVENAELRRDLREQEKMVEMFEKFSPTLSSISVGCGSSRSTIGSISDFQIWDSVLPLDKMVAITGCKELLEGNFLSWEGTDWQLNSSSGAMELEMQFDDICEGGQGSSLALIPYTMSMVPRALHQCSRLGGQVAGYTDQAEFHSIARFLSSRWVDWEVKTNALFLGQSTLRYQTVCAGGTYMFGSPCTTTWRRGWEHSSQCVTSHCSGLERLVL